MKVRGVTGTHGEAVALSKKLQRNDPIHNIFLGEVGKWLPWDPKPHQVQEQEYAEDQLNTLMKGYKTNEEAKDKFVSEQRKTSLTGAKKDAMPMSDVTSLSNDGTAVAGVAGESSSDGWANMFKGDGDLAVERKKSQMQ